MKFDRRAAETLALELSMLAKAHGLNVKGIEITASKQSARAKRSRVDGDSTGSDLPGNTARRATR